MNQEYTESEKAAFAAGQKRGLLRAAEAARKTADVAALTGEVKGAMVSAALTGLANALESEASK